MVKNKINTQPVHTFKDFCSVLIVLFSSYKLLSLALRLSIRFLDKFEMTVDYHLIAWVLDLIWVVVGVAISIYINNKRMTTSKIIDSDNSKNIYFKVYKIKNFLLKLIYI